MLIENAPNSNGTVPRFSTLVFEGPQTGDEPKPPRPPKRTTHTLVISDLHLGSDVCRAEDILNVLKEWSFRRLIILGDAFDDLRFKRLKRSHFKVLARINKLSSPRRKIEIVWVEGNHDDLLLRTVSHMLGVSVHREFRFALGGRQYLAIHGHQFDHFMRDNPALTAVASAIYLMVQRRDAVGMPFSRFLKSRSKSWIKASEKIGMRACRYARKIGANVVLAGHTHIPMHQKTRHGIEYVNTGCWTDSPATYATIDANGVTLHRVT